jgi:hypothetical protein
METPFLFAVSSVSVVGRTSEFIRCLFFVDKSVFVVIPSLPLDFALQPSMAVSGPETGLFR